MNKYDLIKKPVDFATGKEPEKCTCALFPEYELCKYEPEIVVKMFDSLLFQKPDTGLFIYDYKNDEEFQASWENLGKPTLLVTCPKQEADIKAKMPHIPVESIYDVFLDLNISGGCNKVNYCFYRPDDTPQSYVDSIKTLAEDMGVEFHSQDEGPLPYITCCVGDRNELKSAGKDAAHILELIYGMGESNTHLIFEDDEAECDGECSTCSLAEGCEMEAGGQKVDIDFSLKSAPSPLPNDAQIEDNLRDLQETLLALYWA